MTKWMTRAIDKLSGRCEFKDICGCYHYPGQSTICDHGGDEYCGRYRSLWKEKHSK